MSSTQNRRLKDSSNGSKWSQTPKETHFKNNLTLAVEHQSHSHKQWGAYHFPQGSFGRPKIGYRFFIFSIFSGKAGSWNWKNPRPSQTDSVVFFTLSVSHWMSLTSWKIQQGNFLCAKSVHILYVMVVKHIETDVGYVFVYVWFMLHWVSLVCNGSPSNVRT